MVTGDWGGGGSMWVHSHVVKIGAVHPLQGRGAWFNLYLVGQILVLTQG